MKVLVTGGAGYIGSHVVNLLGKQGHDISIIDNLSTGRKESILYGELFERNLEDTEWLNIFLKEQQFDACLHFAGSIIVPESVTKPIKYYCNNTKNSLNLIDLCQKYGTNRFIFSSTAAVYGDSKDGLCHEETPLNPINPYGRSKLMTEWMLEDVSKAFPEFNYVALRYFNVCGANIEGLIGQCSPQSTHLIKIASECASGKRKEMNLYGDDYKTKDGTCIRDYIHIEDLAQAHIDALSYLEKNKKSQVLNCGYGQGHSVKDVIQAVKSVTGADFKVNITGRREGDSAILISKAEKIQEVLSWKPKYNDLELMVRTAFEWEKKLN